MMRWIWPSAVGLLMCCIAVMQMCCIAVMQKEIVDLQRREDPAAAIQKFEKDLFARIQGAENLRQAQQAAQEAAIRRDVDKGLTGLPMGDFRARVHWPQGTESPKGRQ